MFSYGPEGLALGFEARPVWVAFVLLGACLIFDRTRAPPPCERMLSLAEHALAPFGRARPLREHVRYAGKKGDRPEPLLAEGE